MRRSQPRGGRLLSTLPPPSSNRRGEGERAEGGNPPDRHEHRPGRQPEDLPHPGLVAHRLVVRGTGSRTKGEVRDDLTTRVVEPLVEDGEIGTVAGERREGGIGDLTRVERAGKTQFPGDGVPARVGALHLLLGDHIGAHELVGGGRRRDAHRVQHRGGVERQVQRFDGAGETLSLRRQPDGHVVPALGHVRQQGLRHRVPHHIVVLVEPVGEAVSVAGREHTHLERAEIDGGHHLHRAGSGGPVRCAAGTAAALGPPRVPDLSTGLDHLLETVEHRGVGELHVGRGGGGNQESRVVGLGQHVQLEQDLLGAAVPRDHRNLTVHGQVMLVGCQSSATGAGLRRLRDQHHGPGERQARNCQRGHATT
ncbi:hypothetical protein SAMN04488554_2615 [Ruania alba]|uniref:Uncharacterized protein n=1 Tax=Ruania alba TaxID=648782 RepID=A0A1H5L4L9_9MICO|nr:hypothetical protein SAMN04488554_2615 [Ruania alba]